MEEEDYGAKLVKKAGGTLSARPSLDQQIRRLFPFSPTPGQEVLFKKMAGWLENPKSERPVFILRGYAGTGKTAFLSTLLKILSRVKLNSQLMAPTGRASKVIRSYTQRTALTIHKRVFRFQVDEWGYPQLKRQRNSFSNTLFVVDEASMLGNNSDFGNKGLLEELISYVFEGKNNRLLLIGDTAQLPPVGTDLSLALKAEEMEGRFHLHVVQHELEDVVRQEKDSGILFNATLLREVIRGHQESFAFQTVGFPDIFKMKAAKVAEGLQYAYDKFGMENSLVVTRTNKQALNYNKLIRHHLLYREEELESGDWLMVVKNNYSVLEADADQGFLANGDLAMVRRVIRYRESDFIRLVEIEMVLADDENQEAISCLCTAELLYSDLPQLPEERLKKMQEGLLKEWEEEEPSVKKRWARLKTDATANPVQVKFGYALTCHKAQGGQWDAVFVDHGWMKEGPLDTEFYRWLYTAVTRARQQVFLVNLDSRLLD
jgi:ATP-dependent exoDNAse (exonuclease V) alpha subunit